MDNNIELGKILFASYFGSLAGFFGTTQKHLILLIILMCTDTIFGWIKGFKLGKWTSKKAKWGIAGKIAELILICILYFLNWVFKIEIIVYIGIYYFIAVEIASIFENYAEINGNLPKGFLEILKKLQFSIGTLAIKKVSDFIAKVDDKNEDEIQNNIIEKEDEINED